MRWLHSASWETEAKRREGAALHYLKEVKHGTGKGVGSGVRRPGFRSQLSYLLDEWGSLSKHALVSPRFFYKIRMYYLLLRSC